MRVVVHVGDGVGDRGDFLIINCMYVCMAEMERNIRQRNAYVQRRDVFDPAKLRYIALFADSLEGLELHQQASLKRFAKKIQLRPDGSAFVPVNYDRVECGRLYSSQFSMQQMERRVRNSIYLPGTVDIDMVNAAPTIIAELCRANDIPCPMLMDFLATYQEKKADLAVLDDCPSKAKNRLLFAGGEIGNRNLPEWMQVLRGEIVGLSQRLVAVDPTLYEVAGRVDDEKAAEAAAQRRRADREYTRNRNGIYLSYLFMKTEGRILDTIDDFGRLRGWWDDDVTLMFDGLSTRPRMEFELADLENAVETRLGLRVRLTRKPVTDVLDFDVRVIPPSPVIRNSHEEASDVFAMALQGRALCCDGSTFVNTEDGLWTDDDPKVERMMLPLCTGMDIRIAKTTKDGEDVVEPFSANVSHAGHIIKLAKHKIPLDNEFVRGVVLESARKLLFNNGVWHFTGDIREHGVYGYFEHGGSFPSLVKVDRDLPPFNQLHVDTVMDNLINPIFRNGPPGVLEFFLRAISRSMAGCYEDKRFYIVNGFRNSGKSLFFQFLERTFGKGYIAQIPSSIFLAKNVNNGEPFRNNAYAFDAERARITTMSEAPAGNAKQDHVMSGQAIKNFQSLKEGIPARRLFQAQRTVYSTAMGWMLCNDVPKIDPLDAFQQIELINFPNQFVERRIIDADPFNGTLQLARPEIEELIKTKEWQDALTWIVLMNFRPEIPVPTESMLQDKEQLMQDGGEQRLDELFDVTLDEHDKVEQRRVLQVLKENGVSDGHDKFRRELQAIVDKRSREAGRASVRVDYRDPRTVKPRKRYYRGIALRGENDENNGFIGNSR